jgi:hypothetical protein
MEAKETLGHEIEPAETYQIDSSEYDSDEDREGLDSEEYDLLVDEGWLALQAMQRSRADAQLSIRLRRHGCRRCCTS